MVGASGRASMMVVGDAWDHHLRTFTLATSAHLEAVTLEAMEAACNWMCEIWDWRRLATCLRERKRMGYSALTCLPEDALLSDATHVVTELATKVAPGLLKQLNRRTHGRYADSVLEALEHLAAFGLPPVQQVLAKASAQRALMQRVQKAVNQPQVLATMSGIAEHLCDMALGLEACLDSGFIAALFDAALNLQTPDVLLARGQRQARTNLMGSIGNLLELTSAQPERFCSQVWTPERASRMQLKWLRDAASSLLCNGGVPVRRMVTAAVAALAQIKACPATASSGLHLHVSCAKALLYRNHNFPHSLSMAAAVVEAAPVLGQWMQLATNQAAEACSQLKRLANCLDSQHAADPIGLAAVGTTAAMEQLRQHASSFCREAEQGLSGALVAPELATLAQAVINLNIQRPISEIRRELQIMCEQVTEAASGHWLKAEKLVTDAVRDVITAEWLPHIPGLAARAVAGVDSLGGVALSVLQDGEAGLAKHVHTLVSKLGSVDDRMQEASARLVARVAQTVGGVEIALGPAGQWMPLFSQLSGLKALTPTVSHTLTSLSTLGLSAGVAGDVFGAVLSGRFRFAELQKQGFETLFKGTCDKVFNVALTQGLSVLFPALLPAGVSGPLIQEVVHKALFP